MRFVDKSVLGLDFDDRTANSVKAEEGSRAAGQSGNFRDRIDLSIGTHRSFDPAGNTRGESVDNDGNDLVRERELAAGGTMHRDDEMFEDGWRKSSSPKRGVGTCSATATKALRSPGSASSDELASNQISPYSAAMRAAALFR